ncbi:MULTISPECIES: triphosphoribosyl-dephospho-CoA synthase [unclassified Zymobacter]|uniref:triphosphoribosyl-dephospho-CoA synthase n=1 Tax=unclassified Zymobacter TaxID=3048685 RepID=UPI0039C2D255
MNRAAILSAREQRAQEKQRLLAKWPVIVSLSFNLPGLPKSTPLTQAAFDDVAQALTHYLCAHRCALRPQPIVHDAAGGHALWTGRPSFDAVALKALTERFEGEHPLGRLLDVDIYTPEGPIRSGKNKRCLVCDAPALVCMRTQRHSLETLRAYCDQQLADWWDTQQASRHARMLASNMTRALLDEVLLTPKPGLVDQQDCGSHDDMDLPLFVQAISALSPYWERVARQGIAFDGEDGHDALITLRRLGLEMEAAMRQATHGINTHKGAIFLGCLAVFAHAHAWRCGSSSHSEDYRRIVRHLSHDLVTRDMKALYNDHSYGQRLLQTYEDARVGGPRYQAEHGLPAVFDHGLPALEAALNSGSSTDTASLHALLTLMAHVLDTNVLHRSSLSVTHRFMALAQQATATLPPRAEDIEHLQAFCRRHWISAGGCADLLAITLFFHYADRATIPHAAYQ